MMVAAIGEAGECGDRDRQEKAFFWSEILILCRYWKTQWDGERQASESARAIK